MRELGDKMERERHRALRDAQLNARKLNTKNREKEQLDRQRREKEKRDRKQKGEVRLL